MLEGQGMNAQLTSLSLCPLCPKNSVRLVMLIWFSERNIKINNDVSLVILHFANRNHHICW